jgi:hypothetical protein
VRPMRLARKKIKLKKVACFSALKSDRQHTSFTTHSTTN